MLHVFRFVLIAGFIVFGWGIAGFALFFGGVTCETGCSGAGPTWTEDPGAQEWSYYGPLGLAFAVCVSVTAFAAIRRHPGYGLGVFVGVVILSRLLWWRVDLASPNSAGDLKIWLWLGLAVGLAALASSYATPERRPPSRA